MSKLTIPFLSLFVAASVLLFSNLSVAQYSPPKIPGVWTIESAFGPSCRGPSDRRNYSKPHLIEFFADGSYKQENYISQPADRWYIVQGGDGLAHLHFCTQDCATGLSGALTDGETVPDGKIDGNDGCFRMKFLRN